MPISHDPTDGRPCDLLQGFAQRIIHKVQCRPKVLRDAGQKASECRPKVHLEERVRVSAPPPWLLDWWGQHRNLQTTGPVVSAPQPLLTAVNIPWNQMVEIRDGQC